MENKRILSGVESTHYQVIEYEDTILVKYRGRSGGIIDFQTWDRFAEFRDLLIRACPAKKLDMENWTPSWLVGIGVVGGVMLMAVPWLAVFVFLAQQINPALAAMGTLVMAMGSAWGVIWLLGGDKRA